VAVGSRRAVTASLSLPRQMEHRQATVPAGKQKNGQVDGRVNGRKGRLPQGTRRPVLDCVKSMMFYAEPLIYHHISDHSLLGFRGPDLLHFCLVSSPVVYIATRVTGARRDYRIVQAPSAPHHLSPCLCADAAAVTEQSPSVRRAVQAVDGATAPIAFQQRVEDAARWFLGTNTLI
jgi:hypothetical protein